MLMTIPCILSAQKYSSIIFSRGKIPQQDRYTKNEMSPRRILSFSTYKQYSLYLYSTYKQYNIVNTIYMSKMKDMV